MGYSSRDSVRRRSPSSDDSEERYQRKRQRRTSSPSPDRHTDSYRSNARDSKRHSNLHNRTERSSRKGDDEREQHGRRRRHARSRSRSRSSSRARSNAEVAERERERERTRSSRHERHDRRRKDSRSRTHGSDRRRSRSRSQSPRKHRRDRSPRASRQKARSKSRSQSPEPFQRSRKPLPSQEESYRGEGGGGGDSQELEAAKPKEKPNFKPTGLLAAETNKVTVGSGKSTQSIVLKYHEPAEARKPPASARWTMYVFKGASKEPLHTYYLHERTCWLLGKELAVADIPAEHPTCSKQHAVLQFRYTAKKNEWGESEGKVGLYLLDLESANGTFLNGDRIQPARYTQLLSGDVVKFGQSEREYVILLPPKGS